MDILLKNELKELFSISNDPCISIYIPTYKKGADVAQNVIRFKRKLKETESELKELGYRDNLINDLLKQAQFLVLDSEFWNYQESGFACFMSPGQFFYYRVPISFNKELVITKKYQLKPLLPFFTDNIHFYILVIDQKQIRFFKSFRYGIQELELQADVPKSLQESMQYDVEEQYNFTIHTGAPNIGRTAIAYGQGGTADDKQPRKRKILRFFQKVNDGVHYYLRNDNAPLITAGVDYLHSIYREANTYQHLMEKGVVYNTEDLSSSELLELAKEVAKPYLEKDIHQVLERFGDNVSNGRASYNFTEIVKASQTNQISYLLVDKTERIWGRLNPEHNNVEIHSPREPGDEDLIDMVISNTIEQNGHVFVLNPEEMPITAPVAAVFRYSAP